MNRCHAGWDDVGAAERKQNTGRSEEDGIPGGHDPEEGGEQDQIGQERRVERRFEGPGSRKLELEELQAECDRIEPDVYDWLGPENVVRRYQTAGNSGSAGFEQQLAEWKERLKK